MQLPELPQLAIASSNRHTLTQRWKRKNLLLGAALDTNTGEGTTDPKARKV